MFKIAFKGTAITKPIDSYKKAEEVKKELLKHYFAEFSAKDLPIINRYNVVVG